MAEALVLTCDECGELATVTVKVVFAGSPAPERRPQRTVLIDLCKRHEAAWRNDYRQAPKGRRKGGNA